MLKLKAGHALVAIEKKQSKLIIMNSKDYSPQTARVLAVGDRTDLTPGDTVLMLHCAGIPVKIKDDREYVIADVMRDMCAVVEA